METENSILEESSQEEKELLDEIRESELIKIQVTRAS